MTSRSLRGISLLLATRTSIGLLLDSGNLAQHDDTVAVHERDARKTLAVLEAVAHERLLRLEAALSHLVGLERVRVFHLLASSLLAHLPDDVGDAAGSAAAAHEADWRVALLDLVRDVEDLDLSVELLSLAQGGVLLVDHHVATSWHVVLVKTLDVQADVVARIGEVDTRVVHLDGENLASARVGGGVRWQEDDLLTWLHDALLDTAGEHITDTLDLVDARDWHAHWGADWALWDAAHLVEHIIDGINVDGLATDWDIHALPPGHVGGLLDKVVTHPAGDWHEGSGLLNEILLPADLHEHGLHLVHNLLIAGNLVAGGVTVHLVHTDADLLHAEQVDKAGVLTSLALNLTSLVVALGNGGGEITIGRNHDEGHVSLGSTGNHVLDEVAVARRIDDRVVPLLGVELLCGASDGHTALALLLLTIHVEGEGEGALAETLGLRLQLLELTLWQSTKLEDETSSGSALTTVDMAADDDGEMLLLGVGRHGC